MIAQDDALSALTWWQLAGVDTLVADEPRDWLRAPAPPPSSIPVLPQEARPQGEVLSREDQTPPPAQHAPAASLAEFRASLAEMTLPAGHGRRLLPSGTNASGLMLLCAQPELSDREALFEEAHGRLLDAMLAAIGFERASSYLASISPVAVAGRIAPAARESLTALAREHIALAAPRALLLLGDQASEMLLGGPVAATRGRLHEINHLRGKVAAVSTFHPRFLLTAPACKADAWRDLRLLLGVVGR